MNDFPILWRVRAVDSRGVVQYEQDFGFHHDDLAFNPQAAAHTNAARTKTLFPECAVSVEGLTFDQLKKS